MAKVYTPEELAAIADFFYRKHGHYPPSIMDHARQVLVSNGIPEHIVNNLLQGKRDFALIRAS